MKELTVEEMQQIQGGQQASTLECAIGGLAVAGGIVTGMYLGAFMAFVWVSEHCFGS